jgi:DnaK suppressor protein
MRKAIFSPEDLDRIRTDLLVRRQDLGRRVERLSEDSAQENPRDCGEISSLPTHPADLGTEAFEQEKEFGLASRMSEEIHDIDEALARIDEGGYGVCGDCDQPISEERLSALPSATLCARCQAEREST